MLLYPEGGVVLNRTAYEIAELCQRTITATELLQTLVARYPAVDSSAIERDVNELLAWFVHRGLLERDGVASERSAR